MSAEGSPVEAPYGTWSSPLSAEALGRSGSGSIAQVEVDGTDVLWTESRSAQAGRTTVVRRRDDGTVVEVVPEPYDVGTGVHEFGGRAFAAAGGRVWFSHVADTQLYVVDELGVERLTDEPGLRFADFCVDQGRGLLYSVVEDHRGEGEARNYLVRVSTATGEVVPIAEGHDFCAAPRLSPDGSTLAWITWDHPNMPWDGTSLWTAPLDAQGDLGAWELVAGGPTESVTSPRWSPDGRLHLLSDRAGAWTLYRADAELTLLGDPQEECGGFLRILNNNGYDVGPDGAVWYTTNTAGIHGLARIAPGATSLERFDLPFSYVTDVRPRGTDVVAVAASATFGQSVVLVRPDGSWDVLHAGLDLQRDWIAEPRTIEFRTVDGRRANAFYYPPTNPGFVGLEGELPPLVVNVHGGPVWSAFSYLQPEVQFFTSHGFAYLDVNYRGSVGWGREFRTALYGAWGVADVEDAVAAVAAVVEQGLADPQRAAIRGPSAGGWTTLAALAFSDAFACGMASYGVADPERFVQPGGTHKYESRYLWHLIAPYPEGKEVYRERSPLRSADRITAPLLLLQGLEDKVVLPEQSRVIAASLERTGVPVELVEFPREGHGFREAEHIAEAFAAELRFMRTVYGLAGDA